MVKDLSHLLEGEVRPHFFEGVASVVSRLFLHVGPDVAVFGEKDYQQLLVIRRMVQDLGFGIEIVGGATTRETDGLAMSSRNAYLDAEQRARAPGLARVDAGDGGFAGRRGRHSRGDGCGESRDPRRGFHIGRLCRGPPRRHARAIRP